MSRRIPVLAAAALIAYAPATVAAQVRTATPIRDPAALRQGLPVRSGAGEYRQDGGPVEDNRPPVPPGVPTSADNVHLPTEGEVKLGRESATEAEKYYRVVPNGPYNDRLQRIGRVVVQNIQRQDIIGEYRRKYNLPKPGDKSKRVPFEFSFKVVDTTKEINAFSLAGGPVYVTKGLMDLATSDHELAAVLAHECSHIMFHHVEQMVKRQKKLNNTQLLGLLAAVLAGAAGGPQVAQAAGNLALGAQLVSIATLTGYSQDLEYEADKMGARALVGTPYSPVGMLTFMQKLQVEERRHQGTDPGIFRTHPYSNERVAALSKQLTELGYKVDEGTQRSVSGRFRINTVPIRVDGRDACEIRLNGNLVFTAVAWDGDQSPTQRAELLAKRLEIMFQDGLTSSDVKLSGDKSAVLLKGAPFFRAFSEDAAYAGGATTAPEKAHATILRALLQEQLDKPF